MNLTAGQWIEETNRLFDAGIWTGLKWEETNHKDYLRVRRVGASFTLTRQERLAIMGTLFDKVQAKIKRIEQLKAIDAINGTAPQPVDYEAMILSGQVCD